MSLVAPLLLSGWICGPVAGQRVFDVPSGPEIERARELVSSLYASELQAAKTSAARRVLAEILIDRSRRETADGALAYALVQVAQNLATAAGSPETILEATDQLTTSFRTDVIRIRTDLIPSLVESIPGPATARSAFRTGARWTQQALARSAWSEAEEYLTALKAVVRMAEDPRAQGELERIRRRLIELRDGAEIFQAASQKLAEGPSPEACLLVGSYQAFLQDAWKRGLPLLVQCGDERLQEAAVLELKGATSSQERFEIAEAWWRAREGRSPGQRDGIETHALDWYWQSLPDLGEDEKKIATRRIAEVLPPPELPADVRPISFEATEWSMRCWKDGKWSLLPLESTEARRRQGVLSVRNTTGLYHISQLTFVGQMLPADFMTSFEYRGPLHSVQLVPDNALDISLHARLPESKKWSKVTFIRTGDTLELWQDGRPTAVQSYNCPRSLEGMFSVSIESGREVFLRRVHIQGGQARE